MDKVKKGLLISALVASIMAGTFVFEPIKDVINNVRQKTNKEKIVENPPPQIVPMGNFLYLGTNKNEDGTIDRVGTATMSHAIKVDGVWHFGAAAHATADWVVGQRVTQVNVDGVHLCPNSPIPNGKRLTPGELQGEQKGTVTSNTQYSIFGELDSLPNTENQVTEVALPQLGPAQIITTVDGQGKQIFNIEITKVTDFEGLLTDFEETAEKVFGFNRRVIVYDITDPNWPQELNNHHAHGMSGSPIIQDGKLVAALSNTLLYPCGTQLNIAALAKDIINEHLRQIQNSNRLLESVVEYEPELD
ncbi:MAG: hypothetical protein FWC00_05105 [Firmicutes bacterium]|nr:hypothetical protein [Bacillota bacterium]